MIVKKMRPNHLPVLNAVIEILKPETCVECGSGDFSTALLSKISGFCSIEHDKEWAEKAMDLYGKEKIIYIPLSDGIKYSTFPKRISREQRADIKKIYSGLSKECDLLFVDSWACLRDIALAAFWGKFKIAVLHDTQELRYGFEKVINRMVTSGYTQINCMAKRGKQPQTDIVFAPEVGCEKIIDVIRQNDVNIKFRIREF